jgi:predicted amidohydrolase
VLRVSILELPARWGDPIGALDEVDRLLALGPTDLAVLPELALTGYVSPEAEFDVSGFAEPIDGPTVRAASALAARHSVHLVVPLVLAEHGVRYNAAVLVTPDRGATAVYRKRHPWFPETWATPGADPPPLVRIGGLTVTFAICFDAHFLEDDTAHELANADLLVFTSAWVDDEDSRLPLLTSLARSFGIAIANANWGPGVVRLPGQGGSCVIDPRGEVLAAVADGAGARIDANLERR